MISTMPGPEQLELSIVPETIQGKPFRYFTVVKTSDGYNFEDLVLPKGWQRAIPELHEWFSDLAMQDGIVDLRLDPSTKLLVYIENESGASLELTSEGVYKAANVKDLRTAVELEDCFSCYMQPMFSELNKASRFGYYPAIYRAGGGSFGIHYGSKGLFLPGDKLWKSKNSLITEKEARKYAKDVKQMARDLGDQIEGVSFWENGTLASVSIDSITCACYGLTPGSEYQGYSPHNVDTAQQAVILHNAVSMYLNSLLDKGVGV